MNENEKLEEVKEEQNQEITEEKNINEQFEVISDFEQHLTNEDLVNYNFYLIERRAKSSIFSKILGVFIIFLGVYAFFNTKEGGLTTGDIVKNCIFIVIGLLFVFLLTPLTIRMQRSIIKKRIIGQYPEVLMKVVVSNEGISFSVPADDKEAEPVDENQPQETPQEESYEQLREKEYEDETIETLPEELEENKEPLEETFEEPQEETEEVLEEPQEEKFTVPWGGIINIDDDGTYMFVNMVGFQSMLIKKESCPNLDEVKTYILSKLDNPKNYVEKKKK